MHLFVLTVMHEEQRHRHMLKDSTKARVSAAPTASRKEAWKCQKSIRGVLGTLTKLRVRIPRPKPRLASDFRTDLVEGRVRSEGHDVVRRELFFYGYGKDASPLRGQAALWLPVGDSLLDDRPQLSGCAGTPPRAGRRCSAHPYVRS